jgi:hypothetical protein
MNDPQSEGHIGKLHRTPKILSHARRRGSGVAARGARATGEPDRRFQKGGAMRTPRLMGIKGGAIMNVEAE